MVKAPYIDRTTLTTSIATYVTEKKENLLVDPFPGEFFDGQDKSYLLPYAIHRSLPTGGALKVSVVIQPDEKNLDKRVKMGVHIYSDNSKHRRNTYTIDTLETGLSGEFQEIRIGHFGNSVRKIRQSLHPIQVDYWQRCYDEILRKTYDVLNIRKPVARII